MIPTSNYDQLYHTDLKGNEELYIKNDSIVVIHEDKGNTLTLNLKTLRCAFPTSSDSFKVFRRDTKYVKNTDMKVFEIYEHEFKLDLKKSFPDKKQRKEAEKTEAKKITNIILDAIQNLHPVNTPNMKANLAMHTGEYVQGIYEGQCEGGDGKLVITNLGLYFVSNEKGLDLDLPLDLIDSYDFKNKTVKIHYFEPTMRAGYEEGYEPVSKKNRKFEIKIKDKESSTVCDTITAACSSGGVEEIRELQALTEKFGSLTPDELHKEFFTGKFGEQKPIDDYFRLLAKRKWGMANTDAVALQDIHVVAACFTKGFSLDVAGDLTVSDRKLREFTRNYLQKYDEYMKQYESLQKDLEKIITLNLNYEEISSLKKCHPRVIDETIQQMAKSGQVPHDSFEPESLIQWKEIVTSFNEDVVKQGTNDSPYGFGFEWGFKIVCPWSIEDIKRIVHDKNYNVIVEAIKSLDEKYMQLISKIHASIFDMDIPPKFTTPPMHPAVFAKSWQGVQSSGALLRIGRVYREWCKTNPLSEFKDPTDRKWVQYVTDNLDEEKLELIRNYHSSEKTPSECLNDCEIISQKKKTRLEGIVKPKDIPEKDIYADAWFDAKKHRWFTTCQYSRIIGTGLEIMTPKECEQKYNVRAMIFSEDAVQLKHGMPAIYDENNKWWVLLCTVSDDKITKEMVHDKWWTRSLRYDIVESNAGIGCAGGINHSTTQEQIFGVELQTTRSGLVPFDERLRRFLFSSVVACHIKLLIKEEKQEDLMDT